ncbi:hypothetical protein Tco_0601814 [Tanacetum coccineum]
MSSDEASFGVTYTSISSNYEEPSDVGSPGVVVYGYDGLLMHPAPSDEEVPVEDQPYAADDLPIAISPRYVADSDPKEDPEEDSKDGLVDYSTDGGDDDDDDDDSSDDDEEEEEASEDEEEHLAPTNSIVAPAVDLVPSSEEIEPFETDESAATPPPPPADHTTPLGARISERLARCLAAHALPLSPLSKVPHPYGSLTMCVHLKASELPWVELPPRKRLCLTALTLRFKVGESSTAAARPTGGHRADYRFISTLDAKTRRQRAKEVGYGIRDVWVDPAKAVEEVALTTLEGVNARVTELAEVQKDT